MPPVQHLQRVGRDRVFDIKILYNFRNLVQRARLKAPVLRMSTFDLLYIFANFASQFPEKHGETSVDGGFLCRLPTQSHGRTAKVKKA